MLVQRTYQMEVVWLAALSLGRPKEPSMYYQYTLLQQNYEIFKHVDLKGYCSHWAVIGIMYVCVESGVRSAFAPPVAETVGTELQRYLGNCRFRLRQKTV